MAKPRPYLLAPWPYLGDGLGKEPRYATLEAAEGAARLRTSRSGDWLNIVHDAPGGLVLLATTRRDHGGNVWTDATEAGSGPFGRFASEIA